MSDQVIKDVVLGEDKHHRWGETHYKSGLVVRWAENKRAVDELTKAIAKQLR